MRRLGSLLTVVGVVAIAGLAVAATRIDRVPDAGTTEVLWASPYEDVQVLTLERGKTLGGLLESGQLTISEQQAVLLAFSEHASARRVRDGTEVTLRRRQDDGTLRRVEVGVSPDETVLVSRNGPSWDSKLIETPVWIDTVFAAGAIEDVLWNAVAGNAALREMGGPDRYKLIHSLDQVFQWQVDFSRQIQKGDFYRFAVEREVRPDGSMRSSTLLAAELVNAGSTLQAIYFDPDGDGEGSYFDGEGQSVRRAFLTKPLEFRRISSRYTSGRFHPVLKRWRAHRGVDYAANSGTPIMATGDGVIVKRGRNGGLGNAIEVQHPNGFVTRYGHMSRFASGQSVGTRVSQSDVIGYVGSTGLATGPHLHYEMIRGGRHMDPLSVDLPAGDPIPTEAWDLWESTFTRHLALITHLPTSAPATIASLSAEEAKDMNERVRSADQP
jgi:murein DD-endopeptidase MepM/ murein hydrolase activator NlpD